jgi:hypothetical protein
MPIREDTHFFLLPIDMSYNQEQKTRGPTILTPHNFGPVQLNNYQRMRTHTPTNVLIPLQIRQKSNF